VYCAPGQRTCPGTYGFVILAGLLALMTVATWFSGDSLSARETEAELYGVDVVGDTLMSWSDLRFVEAPHGRDPETFRGRVLILRWSTAGCHFCETSAPVLSGWANEYADSGLTVIGIYHPKPPREVSDTDVAKLADGLGLECVLGVDDDWSALEKLWLKNLQRAYTSASLLIDRKGVVRAVHRGGYLTPDGDEEDRIAYRAFADSLAVVLAEKPAIE
jgi:thiol-disulfide isomerase/thioredoxin